MITVDNFVLSQIVTNHVLLHQQALDLFIRVFESSFEDLEVLFRVMLLRFIRCLFFSNGKETNCRSNQIIYATLQWMLIMLKNFFLKFLSQFFKFKHCSWSLKSQSLIGWCICSAEALLSLLWLTSKTVWTNRTQIFHSSDILLLRYVSSRFAFWLFICI